ncbi:succinate dehydrogenase (or fumarate reductase) cytochrome b subunit, b558 family [Pseudopedobacter saltans DSM 12145]|uniref:Succinate dehydrogenase (Or fumarate reductase) cytochrome b subunit, b558 family n=1 Tax=Pseudopedobacter saltans (strain ATCC 51119 / DSM 12145 / JCM 21818 / CCUG 39354 / LMG 10337 / NBRC 100064 / NCIMB 13643) TaxID=762903 RepID=F0S8Y1_PSESL|nr:succinate dehydrogenase cytochrome b subunit [Pseudopedobacter saltans]ADY53468.1 succinate dehydrogenase (or fumarate reductase) cytochrome b subunit, b558 family [Pseudopedobacter saltans DSM 12145]
MSNFSKTFSSTLGRKLIMCLTGLFLCAFLVVHLIGNLQLFANDGGYAFNKYAYFMTHFTPIKVISYLLYISIIVHTVWAIIITSKNKAARPVSYAVKGANGSIWSSRNMGILGTIIFLFVVIHMSNFWYKYHWGATPYVEYSTNLSTGETQAREITEAEYGKQYVTYVDNGIEVVKSKDLYKEVAFAFSNPIYSLFYVLAMAALAFHLLHGFQSAFQTLGWDNSKYKPLVNFLGIWIFSIAIPIGFALMPIYFFLFK